MQLRPPPQASPPPMQRQRPVAEIPDSANEQSSGIPETGFRATLVVNGVTASRFATLSTAFLAAVADAAAVPPSFVTLVGVIDAVQRRRLLATTSLQVAVEIAAINPVRFAGFERACGGWD